MLTTGLSNSVSFASQPIIEDIANYANDKISSTDFSGYVANTQDFVSSIDV